MPASAEGDASEEAIGVIAEYRQALECRAEVSEAIGASAEYLIQRQACQDAWRGAISAASTEGDSADAQGSAMASHEATRRGGGR